MIYKTAISKLSVLTGVLLFTSCMATKPAASKPRPEVYSLLRENGRVNPAAKGYWKSIGNGYMLDASSDSILLYSYTKSFCYKEKNDHLEGRLNNEARFVLHRDTLSIYAGDFGAASSSLQVKVDYVRIPQLPEGHISFAEMKRLSTKKLFSLFIETYEENYAFSKERKVDWPAIRNEFEVRISDSTTEDELFQVFGEIVMRTKDFHTKVIKEDGRTMQYGLTPSAEIVAERFRSQSAIKHIGDYFNLFFDTNYKNISDSLLHGQGRKVANGKLEWGNLTKDIGYIGIHSFTGFAPNGFSRKQQVDSIRHHLDQIIAAFKGKEAIVLDVSFNFGGYDAASLALAAYFTDKLRFSYTSQVYHGGTFYNEDSVYIHPTGKQVFSRPVYILMTDISRSQAEVFAMTMKAVPGVKLAGTNTLGILSGMLGKSIGSFYCTLSNQRLVLPDGKYYEVSGVEPDIYIPVFTKDDVFGGHKAAVRKLVKLIEKN